VTYLSFINELIRRRVSEVDDIVLFGQNIAAGSCLSGLTRGLKVRDGGLIINTPNSENSLVGVGFGLMLSGVSSIFFMKQLDFLLLGSDHLVNTYNFIRINDPKASFTIMPIVVDVGYQGMQSSFNNLRGFCSVAGIEGYTVTNKHDAEQIINSELIRPGFRIVGVSQRLFNTEILECEQVLYSDKNGGVFQYYGGEDVTIVCFNFSFPQGLKLRHKLKEHGVNSSLFTVNSVTPAGWNRIVDDVKITKKIVIIDDSKSEHLTCHDLLTRILAECQVRNQWIITRQFSEEWFWPNPEELEIDYNNVVKSITAGTR
jgi:pyruvate/2-oxoglutarate/acetoin dehydrogenase E1 component